MEIDLQSLERCSVVEAEPTKAKKLEYIISQNKEIPSILGTERVQMTYGQYVNIP